MRKLIRAQVQHRASFRCEYCLVPAAAIAETLHVDHICSKKHGGKTVVENLALACLHCNSRKGTDLTGVDPKTGAVVSLLTRSALKA